MTTATTPAVSVTAAEVLSYDAKAYAADVRSAALPLSALATADREARIIRAASRHAAVCEAEGKPDEAISALDDATESRALLVEVSAAAMKEARSLKSDNAKSRAIKSALLLKAYKAARLARKG